MTPFGPEIVSCQKMSDEYLKHEIRFTSKLQILTTKKWSCTEGAILLRKGTSRWSTVTHTGYRLG